jgi:hypothetical protein
MGNVALSHTFSNATVADADEVNENFTDIVSVVNGSIDGTNIASTSALSIASLVTTGNATIGGTLTQTGVASFTATPLTDHIDEKTSTHGVNIDGVLLKDNAVTASGKSTFGATVQTVTTYTPADAGTATLDVSVGNIHRITMPATGNITIAISNETAGQCFIIEITQGAAGSQTVTWFATLKWAGGSAPTLTTTTGKRDTFGFRVTGTDAYDAFVVGQNI